MDGLTGAIAFKDLSVVISKISPSLGGALGGPWGSLILSLISAAFNMSGKSPQDLLTAVQKDPNSVIKIKQLEMDHETALKEIELKNYSAQADDRKDARKHEEVMAQETGKRDWMLHFLGATVTIGFLVTLWLSWIYQIDTTQSSLWGAFSNGFILILSYYFGSSHQRGIK